MGEGTIYSSKQQKKRKGKGNDVGDGDERPAYKLQELALKTLEGKLGDIFC